MLDTLPVILASLAAARKTQLRSSIGPMLTAGQRAVINRVSALLATLEWSNAREADPCIYVSAPLSVDVSIFRIQAPNWTVMTQARPVTFLPERFVQRFTSRFRASAPICQCGCARTRRQRTVNRWDRDGPGCSRHIDVNSEQSGCRCPDHRKHGIRTR